MGTPPAPIATTPWLEDALSPQTMVMILPWAVLLRLENGLPLKRWHAFQEGQRA
jgi:hypothetical protein